MTEISNEMMSDNGEPLIVGTNTTLNYDATENSNLTYDTESQPLAVGTNLTIEITYAEVELLKEQLGINLDGDDYLGSNITIIDGERDWLERIDNNPFGGESMSSSTTESVSDSYSWDLQGAEEIPADDGENEGELATEVSFSSNSSEPLLVGTNITFVIEEDTDGSSDENESLPERDEEMPFALGTNLLLELPDNDSQQSNYLGTNLSTMGEDSETQTSAMEGDSFSGGMMSTGSANPMSGDLEGSSPFGDIMPTGFGNQPSSDNDDYRWDFGGQLARFSTDDSGGMEGNIDPDALFAASPWGGLTETGAVDGFEDVFPNAAGAMDSNTFAGGFGGGEI